MIFWQLFYTFCKIGIFNFGGGYAMLSLIHGEVVDTHAWLTPQQFTDIVAISQATPGPLGINVATYSGYAAVINAGYSPGWGVLGAFLASFAVILLPVLFMLIVCRFLQKHKDNPLIKSMFGVLRPVVVGLIAAAAILLVTPDNFGTEPIQLLASAGIFVGVFVASLKFNLSPIMLLLVSALVGVILYI